MTYLCPATSASNAWCFCILADKLVSSFHDSSLAVFSFSLIHDSNSSTNNINESETYTDYSQITPMVVCGAYVALALPTPLDSTSATCDLQTTI